MIVIDKEQQLKDKALELGERYREADKPVRIEVGKLMSGQRRIYSKRKRKKKGL